MRSRLALAAAALCAALAATDAPGGSPAAVPAPAPAAPPATPAPATPAPPPDWFPADPGHTWSFPADHRGHPGHRNEWWYFTGLLASEDEPGRRFGYQLTFFRIGLVPAPPKLNSAFAAGQAVMAHLAITDLAAGQHVFSELLWRVAPPYGGFPGSVLEPLAWAVAPPGTPGRWTLWLNPNNPAAGSFALAARDDARGIALDLETRAARAPVLQGPNGYSRKSDRPGYASNYYSYTRLETRGELVIGGHTWRVAGTSWMDKEFGSSQLAPGQKGWDWWSLRLADGRDLMLYVLRRADGTADFRTATLVAPGAPGAPAVRYLAPAEWTVEARGTWRSPVTGAIYPAAWTIRVPGESLVLDVRPELAACENVSALVPGLDYWEGPVRVQGPDGAPAGEGYVELTGYGDRSRPPL